MKPLKGYGLFMYNLCEKTGLYFSKHLWLYWILVFTWALPTTIIGLLVTLVMIILGKKPERYGHSYRFTFGKPWGGITLGLMFMQDGEKYDSTAMHEYGHVHQIILGPFFLFLVGIPSLIRANILYALPIKHKPYDEIWFERSASDLGSLIVTGKREYNK